MKLFVNQIPITLIWKELRFIRFAVLNLRIKEVNYERVKFKKDQGKLLQSFKAPGKTLKHIFSKKKKKPFPLFLN